MLRRSFLSAAIAAICAPSCGGGDPLPPAASQPIAPPDLPGKWIYVPQDPEAFWREQLGPRDGEGAVAEVWGYDGKEARVYEGEIGHYNGVTMYVSPVQFDELKRRHQSIRIVRSA